MLHPYNALATASLVPYARNARTHSKHQIELIANSIKTFGFINPVIVDGSHGIIAGHARVLAALKLGMESVPTLEVATLSEAQKRAYILADNQLTLNAGWDHDLLRVELSELKLGDFNLDVIGFDPRFVRNLLEPAGLTDEDEAPEPEAVAVSQVGEVWVLGEHRLLCGDATKAEDVERLLQGAAPHLMVTDPPYGVEYDAAWRGKARRNDGTGRRLSIGVHAKGAVTNDERADWREAWALFPGDVAYVWHADRHASSVQASLEAANFDIRSQLIWAKNNIAIGRGDYHWQHEPCWYAVRKGKTGHWTGGRKQSTLWEIDKPMKSETGHSTQKPVECMRRPMENNSAPGDWIYDPFVGSGTSIIAAESCERRCLAIEISPLYVDVAIRRWQAFTGQSARCDGDNAAFEDHNNETGRRKGRTGAASSRAHAGVA
jgi:DNA modification methylase